MITLRETVTVVERLADFLKAAAEAEAAVQHAVRNLTDFRAMVDYAHEREFRDVDDVLAYMDQVLLPQLSGIVDALESGTQPYFEILNRASEEARRLTLRLQVLLEDPGAGLLQ